MSLRRRLVRPIGRVSPIPTPSRRPSRTCRSRSRAAAELLCSLAVVERPTIADPPKDAEAIFRSLTARFRPERADFHGVFHFDIDGAAKPHWTITIDPGTCAVEEGLIGEATCTVRMSEKTFVGIETGQRNPLVQFVKGRVKITNVGALRRYDRAFHKLFDAPDDRYPEPPPADAPPADRES
jgi:putative sterol carrier protein